MKRSNNLIYFVMLTYWNCAWLSRL